MTGILIFLALIAAVLYGFGRVLRRRVQSNLQRAGVELPAELSAAPAARASAKGVSPSPRATFTKAAPTSAVPVAPHFVLIYEVAPDFLQRRQPFREEHLALAWKAADAGELVLAGALEEPTSQALLLFRGTREAALRFAAADPYVKQGLVKNFRVKQWHTVVGTTAAAPLRPGVVGAGPLK